MSEAEGIVAEGEITMYQCRQGNIFHEDGRWFANLHDGTQVGDVFASRQEAAQALLAAV